MAFAQQRHYRHGPLGMASEKWEVGSILAAASGILALYEPFVSQYFRPNQSFKNFRCKM
jgi:hypothetical protein